MKMSVKDVKIAKYRIIEKQPVTHDTSRFRFALPPDPGFDFLPGDHVKIYPDRNAIPRKSPCQ